MDTRIYKVKLEVLLKPIINNRYPSAHIRFNGKQQTIELSSDTWYEFEFEGPYGSNLKLEIEHYGKLNADTNLVTGADLAIVVDQIKINGIASPKFVWAGIYKPVYPLHLINEPLELTYSSYLGWNGVWSLDLTLPAFTWIHNIENLGWIYD